jgi:hypothetical protein
MGAAMEVESIPSVYETDNLPLIYAAIKINPILHIVMPVPPSFRLVSPSPYCTIGASLEALSASLQHEGKGTRGIAKN